MLFIENVKIEEIMIAIANDSAGLYLSITADIGISYRIIADNTAVIIKPIIAINVNMQTDLTVTRESLRWLKVIFR